MRVRVIGDTETPVHWGGLFHDVLLVDVYAPAPLAYINDALQRIGHAYHSLYVFDLLLPQDGGEGGAAPAGTLDVQLARIVTALSPDELARFVPAQATPSLRAARVGSSGWIGLIGALNPLETIRQYLCDRHERKKDIEYRNVAERKRLDLELRRLELENVEKRLAIVREAGAHAALADVLRAQLVDRPLLELGELQDRGLIGEARWIAEQSVADELQAPLDT